MWLVLEQKDEQGVHNTPPPVTVSAVFIITQIVSKNWMASFLFTLRVAMVKLILLRNFCWEHDKDDVEGTRGATVSHVTNNVQATTRVGGLFMIDRQRSQNY